MTQNQYGLLLRLLVACAFATVSNSLHSVGLTVTRPVSARTQQSPPKLRIPVYGTVVEGTVEPNQPITVTVASQTGLLKGTAPAKARGDNGRYSAGINWTIEPGDIVQLDAFMGGDPVITVVPRITAQTARDGSVVSGIAPPTAHVEVFDHAKTSLGIVTRDVDGTYSISAAGHPGPGYVVVTSSSGVEFYLGWYSPVFDLQLYGTGTFTVVGAAGRRVDIALSDTRGRIVARYAATLGARRVDDLFHESFTPVEIADNTGSRIPLSEGDTLEVVVGDDQRMLTVPPLEAVLHVADRLVVGRTLPNIDVSLEVIKINPGTIPSVTPNLVTHSDSAGLFSADFSSLDVASNDALQVIINPTDDLEIRTYVHLLGMTLDLNYDTIDGNVPYGQVATLDVKRRNGQSSRLQVKSGVDNIFHADLKGILTSPPVLGEGDTIQLSTTKDGRTDTTLLEVPELDFTLDPTWTGITGKSTPGGALGLYVRSLLDRLLADGIGLSGSAEISSTLTGNFQFRLDVIEKSTKLYPGSRLDALYKLPSGHMVRRTKYVPFANVEVGGPRLCGFAAPGRQVTATVLGDSGRVVATGTAVTGISSRYDMLLRGPGGEPFSTGPGQSVNVDVGEDPITVSIPRMETYANWQGGRPGAGTRKTALNGIGPPSRPVYLSWPVASCFSSVRFDVPNPTDAVNTYNFHTTNEAGLWNATFDVTAPGDGIEVAFFTSSGQRLFQHVVRPKVRAYLYSDRITGRITPGTTMTFTLLAHDGTLRAEAVSGANPDSGFVARFHSNAGAPVAIAPGNVLSIGGGTTESIAIDPLNFDWSTASGLDGNTTPKRAVRIELDLDDRRTATFDVVSGDDGRFKLTQQDISARADWDFGDVVAVRTIIQAAEDVEVAVEAEVRQARSGVKTLFLPRIVRRR